MLPTWWATVPARTKEKPMSDEHTTTGDVEPAADVEQDTEGHNMWINPGSARDLTRSKDAERQRELEKRQRAKEAKGR
jgi:hypothetical protein